VRAERVVTIAELFLPHSAEFHEFIEGSEVVPEFGSCSVSIPHKAWAAGDDLTVLINANPSRKTVRATKVDIEIQEKLTLRGMFGNDINLQRQTSSKTHHFRTPMSGEPFSSSPADSSINYFIDGKVQQVVNIHIPVETSCPEYKQPELMVLRHYLNVVIYLCDIPSGNSSEARCSLPMLILDNCVLAEAQEATQRTRSVFLMSAAGVIDPSPEYVGSSALPRYTAPSTDHGLPQYERFRAPVYAATRSSDSSTGRVV